MKLVLPNAQYKDSFLEAMRKHKASGEPDGLFDEHTEQWFEERFDDWLETLAMYRSGHDLPEDKVQSTQWWVIKHGKWLGRVSLRHELNEHLMHYGGHLGYYLIPEARGKGVGTWAVQQVLEKAKKLGLKKLLVTCDTHNIVSQKVIQKFGGVHQDTIDSEMHGGPLMRWWITLE